MVRRRWTFFLQGEVRDHFSANPDWKPSQVDIGFSALVNVRAYLRAIIHNQCCRDACLPVLQGRS